MKKHMNILLITAGMALFVSVSLARGNPSFVVKHDVGYTCAAFDLDNGSAVSVFHFDGCLSYGVRIDENREYGPMKYSELKLNNKALPITNCLWLKNCQIALK